MFKKNIDLVLKQISKSDVVLDIGGWAQPFNRANYVVDIMPYGTRGFFGHNGPEKEFFSKKTWIVQDISGKKSLPFKDKEIDFVVCSHTLEDIRDPIHLCSEIIRVGKRGYIEVPSRILESTIGIENSHYPGHYHHRWLIEINGSKITFRFKPGFLSSSWKYHFPKSRIKKMNAEERISYFFWNGAFQYEEVIQISSSKVLKELENFVKSKNAYPALFYSIECVKINTEARLKNICKRILGRNTFSSSKSESFWSDMPEIHSK